MAEPIENLIREWGRRGEGPTSVPTSPSTDCLTFPEAAQVARGQEPGREGASDHVAACDRCRRLVADFREALDEEPPDAARTRPQQRRPFRILRMTALAAAALVMVGLGVGVVAILLQPPPAPILGTVEVGLESYIDSGMTPKGEPVFTEGDRIVLRVEIQSPGHLMVLNVGPGGLLVALPPRTDSPERLVIPVEPGAVTLGPYEVIAPPGRDTCMVVATRRPVDDVWDHVRRLRALYEREGDVDAVVDRIRSWPAEVNVLSFEHVPAP